MKQLSFFILYLFFCTNNLQAQDSAYRRMDHYLTQADMKFTLPKGYIAQKSDFYFGCDAFLSVPIHYTILKKNENVLIGIYIGAYISPPRVELERSIKSAALFGETFKPDSNYVYGAKVEADTIHHQIVYLSHEFVKNNYKGDRGVTYVRNCDAPMYGIKEHNDTVFLSRYEFLKDSTRPILKTYNHNQIVSISKDGRGHIELYYLYTDAVSQKEIDEEISETAKMLQFNN